MTTILGHRASGIIYRYIRRYNGCYLMPANVCPIVPLTFKLADVDFKFVDINPESLCIDEQTCLDLVRSGGFAGVIFVHTYGTSYNPQNFFSQLKSISPRFSIIDDRCLCMPDFISQDTRADLTLYSTGYAKYVDMGGGGYGFLREGLSLWAGQVEYLGYDIEKDYKNAFLNKEKIKNVSNGWLDANVEDCVNENYFQKIREHKREIDIHKNKINAIYSLLMSEIKSLGSDFNMWRYNILVDDKENILKEIFKSGLFASSHYQPSSRLFVDEEFPNADYIYAHVINLFNDKYICEEQAEKIAKLICGIIK